MSPPASTITLLLLGVLFSYFFNLPHNIIFKIQFMTTIIIIDFKKKNFKKKFNCRIIKNEKTFLCATKWVIYQFVFELNQARFFPALEVLVAVAAPPDLPGVLLVGVRHKFVVYTYFLSSRALKFYVIPRWEGPCEARWQCIVAVNRNYVEIF